MKKSQNSIKYGDVFRLGRHLLLCGDSRDKKLIGKIMGKQKVRSVINDVPYGISFVESKEGFQNISKKKPILNDHLQNDTEYRKFTREWIEAIIPHLNRKNSFYIFNSDKMVFPLRDGMIDAGLKFGQLLIWVKTSSIVGRMDYSPQHELIAYGWKGVHEFMKTKDRSVLIHPKPNKSPFHPTTKPIPLVRRLILNSTRINDIVFDGFLGSGTTLLACEQIKRKCIGVEIDPDYCHTVIKRFEKLTKINVKKI